MFSTRLVRGLFLVLVGITVASGKPAWAGSQGLNIKQVQVAEGARVDLLLDGKISESQIRTEFINDIIQLSLTDVSVYPAKISSIQGQELTKIFVYQYAPRLVRVRLTVNGRADAYQGKLALKPNGKVLSISLGGQASSDRVAAKASQAQKNAEPAGQATTDAEERALLDRILSADKPAAAQKEPEKQQPSRKIQKSAPKPVDQLVSPWRAIASFAGILVLMAGCLIGLRALANRSGKQGNTALSRLFTRTLGKPAKMIDVVATHYLGPKKSIHVVKVAGRTLVLGVSDGSINLISEFAGDLPADAPIEAAIPGGGDFMAALGEQIAQESGGIVASPASVAVPASGAVSAGPAIPVSSARNTSARDRIRSRLEGMKQL